MTDEETFDMIDKHVDELREHFPHVQILVSWEDDTTKNTHDVFRGKGNWYARVGMAREFLTRDKEHTAAHELGKVIKPDEDEE